MIEQIKCFFKGHRYVPDRAIEREPEGYVRHHRDGTTEPIPACYIVEQCRQCGKEKKIYSSVDIAKRQRVPLEWEND